MAELKTKVSDASVAEFIDGIDDEVKREDCKTVIALMQEVTGAEPKLWGASIVGFGTYTYRYASGREGEWCVMGFAPRKANLTLYLTGGTAQTDLLENLGKHKMSGSCLHLKKLTDIDLEVLKQLIARCAQK